MRIDETDRTAEGPSTESPKLDRPVFERSNLDRPKKIRALLVDDEPLARSNLKVLLRLDPDIEIVNECGSGAEAVAEIRKSKPDLVFLDVQMPECDGFDVLELLGRRSASRPHLRDRLRSIRASSF